MFEQTVCQAVKANTTVSILVDATRVNFLSIFNAPAMMSRFLALVNKLHDYPEAVGHKARSTGEPNDLVSSTLGATAIVIESPSMRAIINGIISVMPTRRPLGFFNDRKEATQYCSQHAFELQQMIGDARQNPHCA